MTNLEMVEALREKASVSYEEARDALEAANWDLLDAILMLEKEGRVHESSARYSTRQEAEEEAEAKPRSSHNLRSAMRLLGNTLRRLIRIGNENALVVSRHGEEMFSLPVTVCVLLLFCSVWTVLIVMAVSLFFGVRYHFRGPHLGKDSINSAMDRAADAVENVRDELHRQENDASQSK